MEHTIVQHSAFGYAGDTTFERAVESRQLNKASDVKAVLKAGGVIYPSYSAAEEFCEKANYPPTLEGLVPQVAGEFADLKIDGLCVYIPVREVVG